MTKRAHPPQAIDKKGDTPFRCRRGFRYKCGRWHQSNAPARYLRFHGTLFFPYSPSLSPNRPMPNALCVLCFIQEGPHNITSILNRGRIQLQSNAKKAASRPVLGAQYLVYTVVVYCCRGSRCQYNEVPRSRYYTHDVMPVSPPTIFG